MEPGEWAAILLGFAGSLLVEVLLVERAFRRGRGGVPARYRDWAYWAVRLAVAAGSAVIAWAYYAPGIPRILYLQIGVSTPALMRQFALAPTDDPD